MDDSPANFRIRFATHADIPFLDWLQKQWSNQIGFMPRPALLWYATHNAVLISTVRSEPSAFLLGRPSLGWQPLLRPIYQLATAPGHQGHHHATQLLDAWEQMAAAAGQLGTQANCAATIPANSFWPRKGYKFIHALNTKNERNRAVICWRKPLARKLPRWFIDPPRRAGHRAKLQQGTACT